ncbi:MAG: polymerase IV-like protein ImuB, partial [bacterium]|nr:polymerase IV-like protein ImuB [bacterium]
SPDKLASTIARLQALVGETRVGAPVVLDRHLPDAFTMQRFDGPRIRSSVVSGQSSVSENDARALALHALRPPMEAEARLDRGELRYLAGQGIGGQVLAAAGPFRVRDGWWQLPVTRDYYDVQLSDGAIYRVFHDLNHDSWHIDGCYE